MSNLKSRVSYLQGLAAGMEVTSASKEGKLLGEIINVLGEFADTFNDLEESQAQLEDYLEDIDEDLYTLEDEIYEAEDGADGNCGEDYVEVECPRCGETVCFESSILEDEDTIEVTCPSCDEVVFVNNDDTLENVVEGEMLEDRRSDADDDAI